MRDLCPQLNASNHIVSSPQDPLYNCVAWSVENTVRYIWPDKEEQYAWPVGIPRDDSRAAFVSFYEMLQYSICSDALHQQGVEKIAIYEKGGAVVHVARQLPNGRWASKLGDLVDIEHLDVNAVAGGIYGAATTFMARRLGTGPQQLPPLHPPPGLVNTSGRKLKLQTP